MVVVVGRGRRRVGRGGDDGIQSDSKYYTILWLDILPRSYWEYLGSSSIIEGITFTESDVYNAKRFEHSIHKFAILEKRRKGLSQEERNAGPMRKPSQQISHQQSVNRADKLKKGHDII